MANRNVFAKGVSEDKKFLGRKILYSSVDESELNVLTIAQVLKEILPIHLENMKEMDYLYGYYKGNQKILNKFKKVRSDINNRVLENNAFHIVEFKKGYVFGDPIQYVQRGDVAKEEINILNKYMLENDKASKDKDLAEDWYITGTAYRMIFPSEDSDKPFDIYNASPKQTFVVYNSGYEHKPLFAGYIAPKRDFGKNEDYFVITIYTKSEVYNFVTSGDFTQQKEVNIESVGSVSKNWIGDIPIIEYPLNKSRLGIIELVMSVLDSLNTISSNDIDDIEQFVQSLLVFVNAEVDIKGLKELTELGAVNITSQDNQAGKADIKLLSNKLSHSETKVLYDRLYNNMLTIAGVPRMSDKVSSGDTGQARLVGEGWTMSDERAKQDELSFKLSEKQLIKLALSICKRKASSMIKSLMPSDIEIKFTRNKSDNLLVKTQGLLNLMSAQVAPQVAFQTVGLFSDPNNVVEQSQEFYGDSFWDNNADKDVIINDVDTPLVTE